MSTIQKEVDQLKTEAQHCNNVLRLWKIASKLTRLGAWQDARDVERKAERIEDEAAARVTA